MTNATEDRALCVGEGLPEPSVREEESEITPEMIDQAVKELWQELTSGINESKKESVLVQHHRKELCMSDCNGLLNAKQAAKILDMTPAFLRFLSRSGHISYVQHGKRQMRWTMDQLQEYIQKQTVTAADLKGSPDA